MKNLILGSTSPRRKALLELINLPFDIVPSEYEEDMTLDMPPKELVQHLSKGKADSVVKKVEKGIVIAADTIVALNGKVMGKPKSDEEARKMLQELSGNTHEVMTGLTLIDVESGRSLSRANISKVTFKTIPEHEIDAYIASGNTRNRAGAYGIQDLGSLFISGIEGDYYGIMGMPLYELMNMLKEFDVDIWKEMIT
ncbi:septum formation inhibitor Maf [Candidatus Uhrbacteria bacterium]|jgi:septum formation protein|nr:septum formation inhibitor Maf [Candidatus Uhrbacteria bacterium]